jgi:hypothetical protein
MRLPFTGEHGDLAVTAKAVYRVSLDGHAMLIAADSCNVDPRLYDHVHDAVGDVEAMFVGMECVGAPVSWIYGPLFPRKLDRAMDKSRRLAGSHYDQVMCLVERFNCQELYVYAMGLEPWVSHLMGLSHDEQSKPMVDSARVIADCRARGCHAERLFGEREMLLRT